MSCAESLIEQECKYVKSRTGSLASAAAAAVVVLLLLLPLLTSNTLWSQLMSYWSGREYEGCAVYTAVWRHYINPQHCIAGLLCCAASRAELDGTT